MSSPLLLDGIKVVEMGQAIAGPFVGTVFADLGAQVVKVEPPEGDAARGWGPPFRGDDAAVFHYLARNKASVFLDLNQPGERQVLDRLVADADVFVHNLRPGVAGKFGVDAATLRAAHPRLIHADVSAFGHVGPLDGRPGYELALQAYGGVLSITGSPEGGPVRAGPSIMDFGSAMWLVSGVLAALVRRGASGEGCSLEASLLETAMGWMSLHLANFAADGDLPVAFGAGHKLVAPYGAYEAADGPIIVATGNDRLFIKLAEVLGHPEWPDDPRFGTNALRTQNRDAIDAAVGDVIATRKKAHWLAALAEAKVPCVPIQNAAELMDDEQVAALGILQPEPGGDFPLVGLPLRIDGERPALRGAAPTREDGARARARLDEAVANGKSPFAGLFDGSAR